MTITKGSTWGMHAAFPSEAPVAGSNRELHRLIASGHRLIGLTGGDLFRTVGGSPTTDRLHTSSSGRSDDNLPIHLPVDLVEVQLDGNPRGLFATHLIGHDMQWRHLVASMNADFWRRYQLGPRAHPNDGVIDTYVAELSVADLLKVRPRAQTGTHVPHPAISLHRANVVAVQLPRKIHFFADDTPIGAGRRLNLTVLPDALTVVV